MSQSSILKVNINYVNTIDGYSILRDINFELYERETLCIIGESGSGKSMTGYCIMGLLPSNLKNDSTISFIKNGEILHNPEELRGKKITMIFQEPMTALNPLFTVGSQLSEVFSKEKPSEIKNKVINALRNVGIKNAEKIYHSYPHQLSGGIRQRVLIAMAFLPEPSIVIADEPTTALDVTVSSGILSLINYLKKTKGISLIFISHDLNIVEKLADRIIVMYGGTIMEAGDIQDILLQPLHPYTIALKKLFDERKKEGKRRLPEIKGFVPSIREMPTGCPFNPRCDITSDICKREMPPIKKLNPNHIIRCFNHR